MTTSKHRQLQAAVFKWWEECLCRGKVDGVSWHTRITNDRICEEYGVWALMHGRPMDIDHNVIRCIRKLPGAQSCKIRQGNRKRLNGTRFPKLMEARRLYAQYTGQTSTASP